MIRSFTLRDIPLVHRLSEQGIVFHTRSALTQDIRPLREALVNMLIGGQFPTFVWKSDDGNAVGFAQLRHTNDETHAYILCLGSNETDSSRADSESLWLSFLDQLTEKAGQQGVHSLIAEVDELGDELPILRQSGFAVYTRQDIWVLEDANHLVQPPAVELTRATPADEWDLSLLYANIVPRIIQLVEPAPSGAQLEDIWILREKGELVAYIVFTAGPTGTWLRLFIHPNAQTRGEDIVRAALGIIPPKIDHPIYCCVRRYQSWVQPVLDKTGFRHISSQAMMVRHTVHHNPTKLVPALSEEVRQKAVAARRNWFAVPPETDLIKRFSFEKDRAGRETIVSREPMP